MFKPRQQCEACKRSAVTLIKYLLSKKRPEVLCTHRRQLLTILLWKITEAEGGKYNTRFQSSGATKCGKKKLRHDHVFQRAKMVTALEKAAPNKVDKILATAVGCAVTIKEHDRLSNFDKEWDG